MEANLIAIKTTVAEPLAASSAVTTGPLKMEVKNLSVYYRAFRAVADVTLPIYSQQITAIIGPSGCGKSTLLRTFNRMNDLVPGARIRAKSRWMASPSMDQTSTWWMCGGAWAWFFSAPTLSPRASSRTSPMGRACMVCARKAI